MSDKELGSGNRNRPDIIAYDSRVLFRGDNEPSNPVTIFEFKRPQRDDFANSSSRDDPVTQIIDYVNKVREGGYLNYEGREILVLDNTQFYGYVVCDLTEKTRKWLETTKNFNPMPDRLGWYYWFGNIKLYLEVVAWDKIRRDAEKRNQIFFEKLGLS